MSKSWTVDVKYNDQTGDYYIEFTPEMLEGSGFSIGDSFYWEDNGDGSYTLRKEDLTTFINKGIISNE